MKRKTAIKNIMRMVERLEDCNGKFSTPEACIYGTFQFESLHVFGSTAKGSDSPGDIDILFDGAGCEQNGIGYYYGVQDASCIALKQLRKGMKMVSFHYLEADGNYKDIGETRLLVWKRKYQ